MTLRRSCESIRHIYLINIDIVQNFVSLNDALASLRADRHINLVNIDIVQNFVSLNDASASLRADKTHKFSKY